MICACTSCGAQFNIPDAKIPDKGARVRCVKCKNIFKVEKNKPDAPADTKKQEAPPGKAPEKKKSRRTQIEQPGTPPPPPPPPAPSIQQAAPASWGEKPPPVAAAQKDGAEEDEPIAKKQAGGDIIKMGSPPWVMTFADLATLMLTFFILMLSFANTDIQKFKEMLGSVQDAFGVQKETQGKFQAKLAEQIAQKAAEKETEKDGESKGGGSITNTKAKKELERQEVAKEIEKSAKTIGDSKSISVSIGGQGINVRIKGAYFFDGGSAVLKREALPFLNNIATIMEDFPFKLKVEGHTDNVPIATAQFPSNWELSAVRATSVLRYFVEKRGIDPLRLTAIGYAANKPIASNEDAVGRAQNRRVQFIFSK